MWSYRLPKYQAIRGVTLGILLLSVIFFEFFGDGDSFGKNFFGQTFETPGSLVLAPDPLYRFPQKFNSINAPYIEGTIPNLSQK